MKGSALATTSRYAIYHSWWSALDKHGHPQLVLHPDARLIYSILLDRAGQKGYAWPSIELMAEQCSKISGETWGRQKVQTNFRRLVEAGLMAVWARFVVKDEGRQTSNRYWLYNSQAWPPDPEVWPPTDEMNAELDAVEGVVSVASERFRGTVKPVDAPKQVDASEGIETHTGRALVSAPGEGAETSARGRSNAHGEGARFSAGEGAETSAPGRNIKSELIPPNEETLGAAPKATAGKGSASPSAREEGGGDNEHWKRVARVVHEVERRTRGEWATGRHEIQGFIKEHSPFQFMLGRYRPEEIVEIALFAWLTWNRTPTWRSVFNNHAALRGDMRKATGWKPEVLLPDPGETPAPAASGRVASDDRRPEERVTGAMLEDLRRELGEERLGAMRADAQARVLLRPINLGRDVSPRAIAFQTEGELDADLRRMCVERHPELAQAPPRPRPAAAGDALDGLLAGRGGMGMGGA